MTRLFPPLLTVTQKGHGRIETRSIRVSTFLNGDYLFPYVGQVAIIERTVTDLNGNPIPNRKKETVAIITSLTPEKANPRRLLELVQSHWHIENKLHYVRDVTFDEDRSRIRKGAGAKIMAALRNIAISLLRLAGATNIASATRHCAWHPQVALTLVGFA